MGMAARGMAAGGQAALAAECTTDLGTLQRVRDALKAGMAGIDPLSRHERLERPGAELERRAYAVLPRMRPGTWLS